MASHTCKTWHKYYKSDETNKNDETDSRAMHKLNLQQGKIAKGSH
jgi:hypothetical protein